MLTNKQIAEKWAKLWQEQDYKLDYVLESAIRDATKQQAERIAELEAALKRNMSRAEKVHELDVVEIGKQKKRIEELREWIGDFFKDRKIKFSYGLNTYQAVLKIHYGISPFAVGDLVTWDDGEQEGCATCKYSKIIDKGYYYYCQRDDQLCIPTPEDIESRNVPTENRPTTEQDGSTNRKGE